MRPRRKSSTVLMLSRVFASLNIIASCGLLYVLILNQLFTQSLAMTLLLLLNMFVSSFVFPAIELRKPCLLVPQLITSATMQMLAIMMIICAIVELDGQKTILNNNQPYYEMWNSFGIDANIGKLCVWSGILLLGNFVIFVHYRAFESLRKR
ncbi:hypothetical protein PRIPAC_97315 [Pristionchus pacificus]|uniref:Uncharacterized protein n=1 Tax=Pristionchus pacificus TaxID=54126 RepID=A0A2A6D2Y8_PRIPA|nr:hypothetical protein PRIPAC_97315 [Pristionchus pacificus]|eukprot:PDM84842.1 hypothetical protein PRIPAC_33865 [Pristionchus pacificus]